MPTGRATLDLSVAIVPNRATVSHYTTTPRIRIAYNRNVFPTSYERNPAFDPSSTVEPDASGNYAWIRDGEVAAYCGKLGMEPQLMVTPQPENESTAWWAGPGVFKPGFQRDSNRWDRDDRLGGNNSDPLNETAANAVGWLSQHADTFMQGGECPKALPLVMDIEGAQAYNYEPDRATLIKNWTARYRLYRRAMGADAELYSYMTPGFLWGINDASPDLIAADRAAMYLLSGIHLDGYRRPAHAAYPNKWRGDIDREIAVCKARYPELAGNVWVTVSPFLDAGTEPMPLPQWKADIEWLVKRHGVHLFVWSSVGQRLAGVKDRLEYLAKYGSN